MEEPVRNDAATPEHVASGEAPPAQSTEHPVSPGEATLVPPEPSHPDIEQREVAANEPGPVPGTDLSAVEGTTDVGAAEEEDEGFVGPAEPLEFIDENVPDEDLTFNWYILKVAVNRED